MKPAIVLRDLVLTRQTKAIFTHLSAQFEAGQFTCLLGLSGTGKSSLLACIANVVPYQGEITDAHGKPLHQQVAYMAQEDLLLPWLSVLDNVTLGSRLRGKKPQQEKALMLLEQVGLYKEKDQRPAKLSGGMRQRVALARTLMEDKPIILMDEPFSALDAITRQRMQALSAELFNKKTVILVTHDPVEALRLGHSIYLLTSLAPYLSRPICLNTPPLRPTSDHELLHWQTKILQKLGAAQQEEPL